MSSIIQLLPDHVANQIAAGEVVQRPASVVKELLENAVDAKATDIKLNVKDGGKTLIQVIDNGIGMSVTDARMCFERHATSKIRIAEDLFALNTKGFRGEALASIAAIAHVELKTRQDQEELGTHIIIEGGKFTSQEMAVVPKGTAFSVKNLFFNIPARRNFLKSDSVELRHITDEFQRVAMAHPNISFSMYHNGAEMFILPASNLRQRIVNIFGGKSNEKLVPIHEETEILSIQGFIGKPDFAKKNRNEQFFFVNDRFIKSSYLHHAILAAYEGLLKDGDQPSYFIYLDVPPHTIDINIHPTKTEIKFDDEQSMYAILRASVKHSLGQFNIAPVLDFDRDATLDTPYEYKEKPADFPLIEVNADFNPFASDAFKDKKSSVSSYSNPSYSFKKQEPQNWESLYVGLRDQTNLEEIEFESEEVTASLFENETDEVSGAKTYQIHKKYIVSSVKSGIIVVNQQRAHERILYEKFLLSLTVSNSNSQKLLFPLELTFSDYDMITLHHLMNSLQQMGFIFDEFSRKKVVISGLPTTILDKDVPLILDRLLADVSQDLPESSFSQNDLIAKSVSKSLSIKTGTYLSDKEQENIINSLFACKEPNVSPSGKPIFINVSIEDIDKKFRI